jgi:hypothetical protein
VRFKMLWDSWNSTKLSRPRKATLTRPHLHCREGGFIYIAHIYTVKPVLRGHLKSQEKVAL